jgi:hypothetical protein
MRPKRRGNGSVPAVNPGNNQESLIWWALKDLNLRPTDYESAALTAELRALGKDCTIEICGQLSTNVTRTPRGFRAGHSRRNALSGKRMLRAKMRRSRTGGACESKTPPQSQTAAVAASFVLSSALDCSGGFAGKADPGFGLDRGGIERRLIRLDGFAE